MAAVNHIFNFQISIVHFTQRFILYNVKAKYEMTEAPHQLESGKNPQKTKNKCIYHCQRIFFQISQ